MSNLPLPLDQELIFRRLLEEERQLSQMLAELEERLQRFEEVERPAYESWTRIEFGPQYADLEKLYEEIRIRQFQVRKIQDLVRDRGMNPREALYEVRSGTRSESPEAQDSPPRDDSHDEEVVEARRRAKREAKRADRKQTRRERRKERIAESPTAAAKKNRGPLVALYRIIARQLHPDSPTASKHLTPSRAKSLWHEVQSAYQSENYERLLAIGAWLRGDDATENSATLSLTHSERLRRLRSLEKSRRALESKLLELHGHPAWDFITTGASLRRKLRKHLAREIEAEFENAQEVVEALDAFFASIGPPRAPRKHR